MGVWGYGLWVMGGEKLYDSYISMGVCVGFAGQLFLAELELEQDFLLLYVGFKALRVSFLEFVYFLQLFLEVASLCRNFLGFYLDFSPFFRTHLQILKTDWLHLDFCWTEFAAILYAKLIIKLPYFILDVTLCLEKT
jgi:hypothetical protein